MAQEGQGYTGMPRLWLTGDLTPFSYYYLLLVSDSWLGIAWGKFQNLYFSHLSFSYLHLPPLQDSGVPYQCGKGYSLKKQTNQKTKKKPPILELK